MSKKNSLTEVRDVDKHSEIKNLYSAKKNL